MKSITIIGSWCNNEEKEKALIDCIEASKKENIDVLIFTRLPLKEEIQKLATYVIYDSSNPVLYDRQLILWHFIGNRKIWRMTECDWGFAAMEQMVKSLGFVNFLDYKNAYWLNYDVDPTNFKRFVDDCDNALSINDAFFFKWIATENSESEVNSLNMTSIGFNIQKSYSKMKEFITIENYREILVGTPLIAEEIFYNMIQKSGLNPRILNEHAYLSPKISNEGDRILGNVNSKFIKSHSYADRIFLAKSEQKNCFVIFFMFIKKHIFRIRLDTGSQKIQVELDNSFKLYIEIPTEVEPTRLEIVSINDEEINEVLDEFIEPSHFNKNFIEVV